MKTKDLNIEKKLIEVDLKNEFSYLLKESEGYLQGWMRPAFANIENDELFFDLGDPVSQNTIFQNENYICNIECWNFEFDDDEINFLGDVYKNCKNELINERIKNYIDDLIEIYGYEIIKNITNFCENKGYKVKFID